MQFTVTVLGWCVCVCGWYSKLLLEIQRICKYIYVCVCSFVRALVITDVVISHHHIYNMVVLLWMMDTKLLVERVFDRCSLNYRGIQLTIFPWWLSKIRLLALVLLLSTFAIVASAWPAETLNCSDTRCIIVVIFKQKIRIENKTQWWYFRGSRWSKRVLVSVHAVAVAIIVIIRWFHAERNCMIHIITNGQTCV